MTWIAPYLLELCDAAQQSGVEFGLATRLGSQDSIFKVSAAKVIQSIVTFSPAGECVAIEFMQQFQKVSIINNLGSVSFPGRLSTRIPISTGFSYKTKLGRSTDGKQRIDANSCCHFSLGKQLKTSNLLFKKRYRVHSTRFSVNSPFRLTV